MRDVLREEKKFLLNQAEALKLRNYLSNVVHTDLHNGPDGYQVRSLYFDSLSNRDFQEKEDGLELRRKLLIHQPGTALYSKISAWYYGMLLVSIRMLPHR